MCAAPTSVLNDHYMKANLKAELCLNDLPTCRFSFFGYSYTKLKETFSKILSFIILKMNTVLNYLLTHLEVMAISLPMSGKEPLFCTDCIETILGKHATAGKNVLITNYTGRDHSNRSRKRQQRVLNFMTKLSTKVISILILEHRKNVNKAPKQETSGKCV